MNKESFPASVAGLDNSRNRKSAFICVHLRINSSFRCGCAAALLAITLFIGASTPVLAWDDGGHLLIGEIAARHLRPEVLSKLEPLLALLDPRYNEGHPYNIVTAGTWMDDMRGMPGYPWATWHYIDFSSEPATTSTAGEPPPPHVLWAVEQAGKVLRMPEADARRRAEALGQLIHLIGDIHQPLHATDRTDHGGTGYLLAPFGSSGRSPKTLHGFWDAAYRYASREGRIIELWPAPSRSNRPSAANISGVIAEQATALLAKYPPPTTSQELAPRAWAMESYSLARRHGWPPGPRPAEYEAGRLTPDFVAAAHEIAARRVVLAGCRLAEFLNGLTLFPVMLDGFAQLRR